MIILISDIGGKGIIMAPRLQAQLYHLMDGHRHRNLAETEIYQAVGEVARKLILLVAVPVSELYD
jgi:hypothetical protein